MGKSYKSSILNLFPEPGSRMLLHVCCAPCSGGIIEVLKSAGWNFTVFFYNPNIYPFEEYDRRKREVMRYVQKIGLDIIDADYENDYWDNLTQGMENEPERGKRCEMCFEMRLKKTAEIAKTEGFTHFATTLGISRWKDMEQVNRCGKDAEENYQDLIFLPYNWRKDGGVVRMEAIAKQENFYRQKYCGCKYSISNKNI
jgi:predicted adenine nucleotide alpha hydrolase (AANH) superfamily ATPase